jgi:hypothetical protein
MLPETRPAAEVPMSKRIPARPRPARKQAVAAAARVAVHRERQSLSGQRRVEVVVPLQDAQLIRQVAARLRASPGDAARTRVALEAAIRPPLATTGKALVDLLRSSPLGGIELDLTRDRTPARDAKFGA